MILERKILSTVMRISDRIPPMKLPSSTKKEILKKEMERIMRKKMKNSSLITHDE